MLSPFYYIVLGGFRGEVLSTCMIPWYDDGPLTPEGLVADFETGKVYAHHNDIVFSINPYYCDYEILLTIPTYHSHANKQIATYDQVNKKYIVPFMTANYTSKIAVIDMITNLVDTIYLQPDKWMDEHQIFCKPATRLNLIDEVLNSTYGDYYHWFIDNFLLQNADENYLFPFEQGNYQVLVDYPAYSSLSNIVSYYFAGSTFQFEDDFVKIYPNPCFDKIEIEIDGNTDFLSEPAKICIYNIQGVKLIEKILSGTKCAISLEAVNAGFYLVYFEDDHASKQIRKILKIK
jgi:hypothetical protein